MEDCVANPTITYSKYIYKSHDSSSKPWWRHRMETFSALLALCAGNSPVPGEFPAQRPVTRTFDAFFDLHLNKRLSKQSWGWWFETLSHPLWRHCNAFLCLPYAIFVNTIHKNDILQSNSNCITEHIICKYTYLLILIWYDFWGAALLERHLEITAHYRIIPIQSRCSNISRDIRRAFWNVTLICVDLYKSIS